MANKRVDDFDFSEFVKEFGHGETNRRAGEVLKKLILACQEARATGSLVLTFKVGALDGLAELKAKIDVKLPQRALDSRGPATLSVLIAFRASHLRTDSTSESDIHPSGRIRTCHAGFLASVAHHIVR